MFAKGLRKGRNEQLCELNKDPANTAEKNLCVLCGKIFWIKHKSWGGNVKIK
jgi:hypothetical protein